MNSYNKFNYTMMSECLQNQMNSQQLYYYYMNQFNNSYNFYQNYCFSKNNNIKNKNIILTKKSNNINITKRTNFRDYKENKENNSENNIFERINNIKMSYRKKNSINTIICDSSFNSFSSEEEDEISEEIDEKINYKKKQNEKRKRLSNISEGISETSEFTSNTSFYSKEEKVIYSEKIENKVENKTEIQQKLNNIGKKNEYGDYKGNPKFENTEILRVNVKISKDKISVFKLKRYDDIFETIKLFCEINSVDEKLIKPLIIKSLSTLNTIYQVMNSKLDNQQMNLLKEIKNI